MSGREAIAKTAPGVPVRPAGGGAREQMRRGWCPGARRAMETGDGLLVRVHPRHGRLTAEALRGLAEAAIACGNGVIDLTGRGNLQIRGVSSDTHASLLDRLDALGLLEAPDAKGPLRVTIVSPLAGLDPTDLFDAEALAEAVERAITPDFRAVLPPKFGIVVDGGGALALDDGGADLRLRGVGSREAPQVAIALATRSGEAWIGTVLPGKAAAAACALAAAFAEEVRRDPAIRRLRDLADPARERVIQAVPNLRTAPEPSDRPSAPRLGPVAGGTAVLLGLPFGQTTAAVLACLADWSERFGRGEIRLSPWRSVALMGRSQVTGAERDPATPSPTSLPWDEVGAQKSAHALPSPLRGGAGVGVVPKRAQRPKQIPAEASFCSAKDLSRPPPLTPPRKGEGTSAHSGTGEPHPPSPHARDRIEDDADVLPSPLRGGAGGGGRDISAPVQDGSRAGACVGDSAPFDTTPTPAPPRKGEGISALLSMPNLLALASAAGLIVDPDDARARIVACPGAPACARGLAPTLTDAARIAAVLPAGWRAHVSGCAKGCAGRGSFDLTLVAESGRYGVIPNGGVDDTPALQLAIAEVVAALSPLASQPGIRPEALAALPSGPSS